MSIEPGTSPKHRYELIKATLLVIIGALITITIVYGIPFFSPKNTVEPIEPGTTTPVAENTNTPVQDTPTEKVYTQEELNTIFEMDKKSPETKLYYSPKLGVGFTYAPYNTPFDGDLSLDTVREINNTIYLTDGTENPNDFSTWGGSNSLEIFSKNPNDTLEQAIRTEFLIDPNSKDCFVETRQKGQYYRAYISYTPDTTKLNDDNIFWGGEVNCPAKAKDGYVGNPGSTYFFTLNVQDISSRNYGFLIVGSGAESADAGYKDSPGIPWFETIRFLK